MPVMIVTGGGRGIGAAIVRLGADRGWDVAFSYVRDRDAADALARELTGRGHRTAAIQGDVAEPADVLRLFDETDRLLGPASAVVNNAGITGPIGRFVDADLATLRRVLDVNVLGAMLVCQEAVRRWTSRGAPGCIVNISSIASTLGAPGEYVHYAAGKAAVETLTLGLAKEVAAHSIRVNCVAPGTVYTDIHAAAGEPDRPARVVSRVPLGRIGDPDEIARAVLWLASAEASYITGATLRVSGGL